MKFPIYLDHAATTPVAPEVFADMLPFFSESYGNPSTAYGLGLQAADAVERSRTTIAAAVCANPEEIIFTSGGTEADNLAILGCIRASTVEHPHVLISAIEHHAVLDTREELLRLGCVVDVIPVDGGGMVEPNDIKRRIKPSTVLVSVMHANNETGAIQPVEAIGAICREMGVRFHVDAVQTLGKLHIDVERMQADLVSFSSHKLYGPKGVGALYARASVKLSPLVYGGRQELGRRAGTINVPGAVGMGNAVKRAVQTLDAEAGRLAVIRDLLIDGLLEAAPGARLTGSRMRRLPDNVHICLPDIEAEPLLVELETQGIYASAGSACTTGNRVPSHVLVAMGIDERLIRGAIRFSLGRETDAESVQYVIRCMAQSYRALCGFAS